MDIVAENLPSPSTNEVFLLNQVWCSISATLEKLCSLAKAERTKDLRVPVFQTLTLDGEFFCLGLKSRRIVETQVHPDRL